MKKGELRKQTFKTKMAEYILHHGLHSASLRNLAEAAETSDRMLLHYFHDKEQLLTEVLTLISDNLITILKKSPADPMPFSKLVPHMYHLMKEPEVKPFMRLWLELIALASKKENPYFSVARIIGEGFQNYFALLLDAENEEQKERLAALTLVTVEGIALLDAIDFDASIEKAIESISSYHEKNT
ncbi:TetR family transcriptional regulator [Metabacillus sp. SLBN-84]